MSLQTVIEFIQSQEIVLGLTIDQANLLGSILINAIRENSGERRNQIKEIFEKLDTAPSLTSK